MEFFESEYFTYKNNRLYCDDTDLEKLTNSVDTPVYVYSKKFIEDSYRKYSSAFGKISHKIFYACKANYNISIIKLLHNLGAGIDVNSAGEFLRAKKAGVNPKEMIFSGVGKTAEEIELLLSNDISLIKSESFDEIKLINHIAEKLGKRAPVAIRVNPNVDPVTHPYISTGLAENKFGIDEKSAPDIFIEANNFSSIKLFGIDMHIGSQITKIEPFIEAAEKLTALVENLKAREIYLSHIDIGGGMGIRYKDESPFEPHVLAEAIIPIISKTGCQLYLEPGRSLVANSGCLITKVLYAKKNLEKNFIIVDAAMNDMLRPSIYSAYHHIQPLLKGKSEDITADIVGPVCESGDFLGKNRILENCESGDLLALMSAGAYGMVMSSNYNARKRPAEVLVDGENFKIIRSRETYQQIMQNELDL